MTLAAELARCDREIAEAAAYTGPDELGALHGWTDWMIEKEMIVAEISGPRAHLVQPGLSAAAEPVLRSGARPVTGARAGSAPIVYDLCCGSGGWADGLMAAGYRVIGYDINPQPLYPGEFHEVDVKLLNGVDMRDGALIVASPPCEEFSRHSMPWTRARNPPAPDLSIVVACWRIQRESGIPMVMENVREAQRWMGRAKHHSGPFYLWGDVPALMPQVACQHKEKLSSAAKLKRARVPFELARWIGECFWPITTECAMGCGYRHAAELGKYGCPNCNGDGLDVDL